MSRRALTVAAAALALSLAAGPAAAEVHRYALVVGNNVGQADEARLRFAEEDARRVHDVLREVGGFAPEQVVLLRGEDGPTFLRALIGLNERIRMRSGDGSQSELIVYYSGHADQKALHLGDTTVELAQLEQLVRGSAASFRILVLDACRSGALTRVKGGRIAPGFAIELDQRLPGNGVLFWTAAAASEDAQESEALGGSFFTHYLVSGLLGAADADRDGRVTVGEAYQYAYDNTLRASSRTLSGMQHPTFHYEMGGHGQVVLTLVTADRRRRALVHFPPGKSYLVVRDGEHGPVVAEVGAYDRARRLSLKPGRYFVRGRGADHLLEGVVELASGEERRVREQDLDRIEYARLVRKGHGELRRVGGLQLGYSMRSALWDGASPCHGPFASYAIDLPRLSLVPRLGVCRGSMENEFLRTDTDELDAQLRASHAWDVRRVALSTGITAGGSILRQAFTADGEFPSRTAWAAHLGVLLGATADLVQGFYVGAEADAMTYFFHQQDEAGASEELVAPFALRASVLIGRHW